MNEIRPILPQLLDGELHKSLLCTRQASCYYLLLQNLVDCLSVRSSRIICLHRFILFLPAEFFKLMNEVENEDLVFTLETIVDKFGEEMAPYALGLCQNLVWCAFFISRNGSTVGRIVSAGILLFGFIFRRLHFGGV